MNSQLNLFENEQDAKPSIVYRGGSLASRIALQESVKRLVTNVISGRKCGESLAKLSRDGLWLKTSGDYCQAKMDGSFEEYYEILPTWGLMLDGVLIEQPMSERFTPESGLRLLPTTVASEGNAVARNRFVGSQTFRGSKMAEGWRTGFNDATYLNPNYSELAMGFPDKWTDCTHSETP